MPGGDSSLLGVEKVTWFDAHSTEMTETLTIEEVCEMDPEEYTMFTIGWVLLDDKDWLVLGHEITGDGCVRGTTAIPARWIQNRERLCHV